MSFPLARDSEVDTPDYHSYDLLESPYLTTFYYHYRGKFLYESSTNYSALVLTKLVSFNYYKKKTFFSAVFHN